MIRVGTSEAICPVSRVDMVHASKWKCSTSVAPVQYAEILRVRRHIAPRAIIKGYIIHMQQLGS